MKGKTGTLVVSFTTADLDNDQLVTTNWQYSMDGKNWVNIAPEAIGNNPARTPGSYTISWDTTVGANSLSGIEDKDVWFRMSVLEYGKSRAVPVQSNVYGSFEVDNYNWRPVWNKTPIVQLDEDTKLSLSLTDYAFDGDNDPLSFFLVTPPSSSFGVSLIGSSGNTLSVNPSINFSGSANFILRVSDGLLSSNVNAAIVIRPVNDPPTIAVIPGFTLSEDTSLDPATDLKDYVYDSDNFLNELSYSVQSMSHPEIGAYINGSHLVIRPAPDWFGQGNVSVKVADRISSSLRNTSVTVNAVPDPPKWLASPFVVLEEDTMTDLDLDEWIFDPDLEDNSFFIMGKPAQGFGLSLSGPRNHTLFVHPAPNFSGSTTLTVSGTDGIFSVATSVSVQIVPKADPTRWRGIPKIILDEDTSNTWDLDGYTFDADGDPISYFMPDPGPLDFGISLSGPNARFLNVVPAKNFSGNTTIKLIATDGIYYAGVEVPVIVRPLPDPPVLQSLPKVDVLEDATYLPELDLHSYVTDSDTDLDDLAWSFMVPSTMHVSVSFRDHRFLGFHLTKNWNGEGDITVTVSDGKGRDTENLHITVTPVNDPPVFLLDQDLEVMEDGQLEINVSGITTDADSDPVSLEIDPSTSPELVAKITGGQLSLRPRKDINGDRLLSLNAKDGKSTTQLNITVHVIPMPDPPIFNLPSSLEGKEDTQLVASIKGWASDVDGDTLTWSVLGITPTLYGEAELNGERLTFMPAPDKNGEMTIGLRIDDGTFIVNGILNLSIAAVDDPPRITAITSDLLEIYYGEQSHITVEAFDPEEDPFEISCSATFGEISGAGPDWTYIAPFREGKDTVKCQAVGDNGQDSSQISINVLPSEEKNSDPLLLDPFVTVENGDAVFQITYLDKEGNHPERTDVVVDDVSYNMDPVRGEIQTGLVFLKTVKGLGPGSHKYMFFFKASGIEIKFPSSNYEYFVLGPEKDSDGDGLSDAKELKIAQTFQPYLVFSSNEDFYPMKVNDFLKNSKLVDFWGGTIAENVTSTTLRYNNNKDNVIDLKGTTMKEYLALQNQISSSGKHVYYRVFTQYNNDFLGTRYNFVIVQYWFFYLFNNYKINNHEGDWEMFQVIGVETSPGAYRALVGIGSVHDIDPSVAYYTINNPETKVTRTMRPGSSSTLDNAKIWIAKGGHGVYLTPPKNGDLSLLDSSDGKNEIGYEYTLHPLGETGKPYPSEAEWLNFKGKWGNYPAIESASVSMQGPTSPPYRETSYRNNLCYGKWSYWQEPFGWYDPDCILIDVHSSVTLKFTDGVTDLDSKSVNISTLPSGVLRVKEDQDAETYYPRSVNGTQFEVIRDPNEMKPSKPFHIDVLAAGVTEGRAISITGDKGTDVDLFVNIDAKASIMSIENHGKDISISFTLRRWDLNSSTNLSSKMIDLPADSRTTVQILSWTPLTAGQVFVAQDTNGDGTPEKSFSLQDQLKPPQEPSTIFRVSTDPVHYWSIWIMVIVIIVQTILLLVTWWNRRPLPRSSMKKRSEIEEEGLEQRDEPTEKEEPISTLIMDEKETKTVEVKPSIQKEDIIAPTVTEPIEQVKEPAREIQEQSPYMSAYESVTLRCPRCKTMFKWNDDGPEKGKIVCPSCQYKGGRISRPSRGRKRTSNSIRVPKGGGG